MKYCCIAILGIVIVGCTPSLIKKGDNESLNVRYEILKDKDKQILGSAMKIADSLTNTAIKQQLTGDTSIKKYYLKMHIGELKWFCPDRAKIETEGFAVGFTGGIIGASIWGTKNFTTVYGISNINVEYITDKDTVQISCIDTVNFKENYMNYSSSKTKKRAIAEVFNKSLECIFSKLEIDGVEIIQESTTQNEVPLQ